MPSKPTMPRTTLCANLFCESLSSSEHSYENFVYCFDLVVGLWVIGCRVFMAKTQLFNEFGHHEVSKVATVICDNILRNTKMGYDVIKNE
jgi:hypothetical protein